MLRAYRRKAVPIIRRRRCRTTKRMAGPSRVGIELIVSVALAAVITGWETPAARRTRTVLSRKAALSSTIRTVGVIEGARVFIKWLSRAAARRFSKLAYGEPGKKGERGKQGKTGGTGKQGKTGGTGKQ